MKKYDEFDNAQELKGEDKVLICQYDSASSKNINTLTTMDKIKEYSAKDSFKTALVDSIPENADENTLYMKVISTLEE